MFKYIVVILSAIYSFNLNAKSIGFGIMLGAPTGISAKYNIDNTKGVALATSWKLSGNQEFYLHGDYLIKKNNFLIVAKKKFHLFYGGGVKLLNRQLNNDSSELTAALRIPVGLSYNLRSYRLEFFGELVLSYEIVPESAVGFDLGLGFRYYL